MRPLVLFILASVAASFSVPNAHAQAGPQYCGPRMHRMCVNKCDASFAVSLDHGKVATCKRACALRRASCSRPKVKLGG